MNTATVTMTIRPRDLRVGDRLPRLQGDYSIADVPVVSVEAIRPHGTTLYRVVLEGDDRPLFFQAGTLVTVRREEVLDA